MKHLKRLFLFLVFMMGTLHAGAIRHVGSGGGDAENKILEMMTLFPSWVEAVGIPLTASQQEMLRNLKVQFLDPNEGQDLSVYISSESLYLSDQFTAKSDEDLLSLMSAAIFQKIHLKSSHRLDAPFLPLGKVLPWGAAIVFKGETSDYLFSREIKSDLNHELQKKMTCSAYRYLSEIAEGSLFSCLDSQKVYLVTMMNSNEGSVLVVRYFLEE